MTTRGTPRRVDVQMDAAQQHHAKKEYAEARRLFGLAADQGLADAQFNLGYMLQHGQGGPQDYVAARRLYGLAADQGDADAQSNLGYMHENGQGGPQNVAAARRWYGLAADQGHADARSKLDALLERESQRAAEAR